MSESKEQSVKQSEKVDSSADAELARKLELRREIEERLAKLLVHPNVPQAFKDVFVKSER